MALWLGESFANIKGQITNFTKEVLAETPEEEGEGLSASGSDELKSTKTLVDDLQTLCAQQRNEIEHFKLLAAGFEEKSKALDTQNKSLTEYFQKLIESKDDENKILQERIEEIQKDENHKLKERIEEIQNQNEENKKLREKIEEIQKDFQVHSVVEFSAETNVKNKTPCSNISVQTELLVLETSNAETTTDPNEEEDEAAKAEQESYLRELEERCTAYQNDLYVLRGELMTLQSDVDQNEETRAKLNEELFGILHSDFMLEGHPALPKPRFSGQESSNEGEEIVLSALRQLASIWRGLNDKKSTLERTVTKLTAHHKDNSQQEEIELPVNECECPDPESSNPLDYFPPRLDSFGLETIEEERNEEDYKSEVDSEKGYRSRAIGADVPSKPEVELSTSSTQTDMSIESDPEILRENLLASLESNFVEKERSWSEKVNEKEDKVKRLESELLRLKNHLVDMEDQHTSEVLASEEKERFLGIQIAELQKQIAHILQQSERSSEVRDEISRLETERDYARAQNRSSEDQLQKLGTQLQNLNFVLEQFQQEKEVEITGIRQQFQNKLSKLETFNKSLQDELSSEKELLDKARSGLDAARHLNLQIEEKARIISSLRTQVQEGEGELLKLKSMLDEVSNNNVAKIDRYLVKNLIVGYFSTPTDKRQEVLRIIATVLDFNREDRQKTGLESISLWPFKTESSGVSGDKQSLSEAFINFLETESRPKAQIRIPLEEMAQKHSRSASESSSSGAGPSHSGTEMSMNLPVLNQADRSNSILKDVLNPRT